MLQRWRRNNRGVLYVYIVIIITIFAVGFFSFIIANAVGAFQHAINPDLTVDQWVSSAHFDAFSLAATFVTNLWVLFPAFLIFGLLYWGYIEGQRRQDY